MVAATTELTHPALEAAVNAAKGGDPKTARQLLAAVVAQEPENVVAWIWLASVSSGVEEKRAALRQATLLTPHNQLLQDALHSLWTPQHIQASARKGVFISYARSDDLFAINLAHHLRAEDVPVWLDMLDVPEDADWHETVAKALNACGVMLMIVSPAALAARDVRAEWHQFLTSGKIALPVLYHQSDLTGLERWIALIDFRRDEQTGLQQLLRLLTDRR